MKRRGKINCDAIGGLDMMTDDQMDDDDWLIEKYPGVSWIKRKESQDRHGIQLTHSVKVVETD